MLGFGKAAGLLAVVLATSSVRAWDPPMRVRIADEAVRFMPASLRLALERHREDVLRGMIEPMADEDGASHQPESAGGSLDRSVADASDAVVSAIAQPESFREIARRFGRLAHFVADAAFPPGAAGKSGAGHYRHFAVFAASRIEKFPLVFLGHEDAELARGDTRAFARRIVAEAAREDAHLRRAYAAAGDPPAPDAFDDRSVPFAVASLSYSRAVNDIVRAWLVTWRRAGGDDGRTPYVRAATRKPVPAEGGAAAEEPPIVIEIDPEEP